MKQLLQTLALPLLFVVLLSSQSQASHLMGADLTYECLGNNEYVINLSLYRDCSGISLGTTAFIRIVDSSGTLAAPFDTSFSIPEISFQDVTPLCPPFQPQSTCQGGTLPGVEQHLYRDTVTLPYFSNKWIVSYSTCCRNAPGAGYNMMPGCSSFYIECMVNNSNGLCNSSPFFTSLPVPYMCPFVPQNYNNGTVDPENNTLVYSLINPKTGAGATDTCQFNPGYSVNQPIATWPTNGNVAFSNTTGQLGFTPNAGQTCVLAMKVEEYNSGGTLIGYTMRDVQVVILAQNICVNTNNTTSGSNIQNFGGGGFLIGPNEIEVCPGNTISFDLTYTDPDPMDVLTVTANTQFSTPGATFTTVGTNPVTATYTWTPSVTDTGTLIFVVEVADDYCPAPGISYFAYFITIAQETNAGPDRTYCTESGPIPIKAVGGTQFNWFPTGGLTFVDPPANSQVLAAPNVTTTYVVTSNLNTNGGQCNNHDSVTVFVYDFEPGAGPLDPGVCNPGESIQLNDLGLIDTLNYAYVWSTADMGEIDDYLSPQPTVTPDTLPTSYFLTVVEDSSDLTCRSKQYEFVVGLGEGPLSKVSPEVEATICRGDAFPLLASGGVKYAWSPSSSLTCGGCNDPVATPYSTTDYTVKVYNEENCFTELTTRIVVLDKPTLQINGGEEVIELYKGEAIILEGVGTYDSISWSPVTGLSDATIPNPIATPTETTTYIATVYNSSTGCFTTDTIQIVYKGCQGLGMPEAFSPNGDGINDQIFAFAGGYEDVTSVEIYNRWGKLVHKSNNLAEPWDGTYNGKDQEIGTYIYFIKADCDGAAINIQGNFALIR